MTDKIDRFLDRWINKTKKKLSLKLKSFQTYFKRLLFPLYLFPIKLITYYFYYIVNFTVRFFKFIFVIIKDNVVFPFKSSRNFLKSLLVVGLALYLYVNSLVIMDYLNKEYGYYGKFFCSYGTKDKLKRSVVRIVGGKSEGSGFFISADQVLTNFHVIANEPSPKIIFPDGTFITPVKITGDKEADLALLYTQERYENMTLPLPYMFTLSDNEPLISVGYPFGTELAGPATVLKGTYVELRKNKSVPGIYIQTNINVVTGMSGGPLTDTCGNVVGINTLGVAGLSLFISADWANYRLSGFTDQDIQKINVDPSKSPEDAVKAFYTYLKARRMQDGFNLLSSEYLKTTDYQEWTGRFKDILDVDIYKSVRHDDTDDTAFVKFSTKNWNDNELETHYYEGTWQTVPEDGVYKMLYANIIEVYNPTWMWFYE